MTVAPWRQATWWVDDNLAHNREILLSERVGKPPEVDGNEEVEASEGKKGTGCKSDGLQILLVAGQVAEDETEKFWGQVAQFHGGGCVD